MIFKFFLILTLILILIIFFVPIYIILTFKDAPSFKIKFLCFSFNFDGKNKNVKQKKISSSNENKNKFTDILKKRRLSGFLSLLKDIALASSTGIKSLLKYLNIDHFVLKITVRSEDAANTAIKYGAVCATVYPLIGIIQSKTNIKNHSVQINHDFENHSKQESSVDFFSTVHICLGKLFFIAILILKDYIKRKRSFKNESASN